MERSPLNVTVLLPLERLLSIANSSGTLDNLTKLGRLQLLLPYPLVPSGNHLFHHYRESSAGRIYREILLNVDTMQLSAKIKSFETRIRMILGISLHESGNFRLGLKEVLFLLKKPRTFLSYIAYVLSKLKSIHIVLRKFTLLWPSFIKVLLKTRPDVVLIFSGGAFSGVENVCLYICKLRKIPSVLIVDNWDNLNSKSIFWVSPTGLGVWGENMKNDAFEIHQMRPKVVRHIGSARFRPNEREIHPVGTDFVFFAGSGKPLIDELGAVFKVRECLDTLGYANFNLIYRPHPMSDVDIKRIKNDIEKSKGIQLDSSLQANLEDNFYTEGPLRYLESLCKFASLVIAPQSSVIVESLSMGTPVIALNWSEYSPNIRPLEQYTHFGELKFTRGFFSAHDFGELRKFISEAIVLKSYNNLVPEILPTFSGRYQERIISLVCETFDKSKEKS